MEVKLRALFERLPGFPEGADGVISIAAHTAAVPAKASLPRRHRRGSPRKAHPVAATVGRGSDDYELGDPDPDDGLAEGSGEGVPVPASEGVIEPAVDPVVAPLPVPPPLGKSELTVSSVRFRTEPPSSPPHPLMANTPVASNAATA